MLDQLGRGKASTTELVRRSLDDMVNMTFRCACRRWASTGEEPALAADLASVAEHFFGIQAERFACGPTLGGVVGECSVDRGDGSSGDRGGGFTSDLEDVGAAGVRRDHGDADCLEIAASALVDRDGARAEPVPKINDLVRLVSSTPTM